MVFDFTGIHKCVESELADKLNQKSINSGSPWFESTTGLQLFPNCCCTPAHDVSEPRPVGQRTVLDSHFLSLHLHSPPTYSPVNQGLRNVFCKGFNHHWGYGSVEYPQSSGGPPNENCETLSTKTYISKNLKVFNHGPNTSIKKLHLYIYFMRF